MSDPLQVARGIGDHNALSRCIAVTNGRHGLLLHLTTDGYIGRSLEVYGEFSEAELALWQRYLQPGDVVCDVGANIGAHTVALAQMVGPSGLVLAFEPIRFLYHLCCGNVAVNGHLNVRAYPYALGATNDRLRVPPLDFTQPDCYGGLPLGQYEQGELVDVIPLDGMQLPRCALLKIDVEGMELDVLQGAAQLVQQHQPVVYVEYGQTGAQVVELLQAWGYRCWWHRPPLFNPDNYFHNRTDVFAGQFEGQIHNVLALPHGSPPPEELDAIS